MASERVILKNAFVPAHYAVTIEPDLTAFTFNGSVDISGTVHQETTKVILHAKEIMIPSATYVTAAKKSISAFQINFNVTDTTVEFVFPEALPAGDGVLKIPFVGQLNNQMAGFYRSGYTDINGNKKVIASTQFEPLDARRSFPCIDEPAVKGCFGVTLVVPANLTAFSNMPEVESSLLANGKKRLKFMDTPKMSTYLLAYCVGEFDFVQCISDHGVLIRVYTPPGKAEQGLFSLDCAKKSLDYFDEFFAIPYPLPKLDMVAIPEFAMGAMENWGLVTYREVALLIDPATASSLQRERVCTVVAHELAHQWFGNLVTMAWWSDLWLNEGFATFMQNLATDKIFPDWLMWEQFGADTLAGALGLDALRSSHPIQVPIKRAEEVEEVFDHISYLKGASVNRMLYSVLGEEAFRNGLRLYMARHKYSNTETVDLWAALGEASARDVKALMASWTEQMGYPLLRITDVVAAGSELTLKMEQKWFLADGSEGDGRLWTIPLIASAKEAGKISSDIPLFSTGSFEFKLGATSGWIKINAGQTVPVRVAYTPELLQRLFSGVRDKSLPAADRAGLLLDTYALVKAGVYQPESLLDLLAAFNNEDNATVWGAISQALMGLDKILLGSGHAMHAKFTAFAAGLIGPAMARVGWEPTPSDGHRSKLMRATLVALVGRFSTNPVDLAHARKLFAAVCANPTDPASCPSDYKTVVFQMVLRAGGAEEYAQLKKLFEAAQSDVERKHVMLALGYSKQPELQLQTLDWTTSGAVKLQDFFYPMMSVAGSSRAGLELMWNYFQTHFDKLKSMLATASPSLFDAAIGASCAGFTTTKRADEVTAFFEAHPLPANQRSIAQMTESIRVNAGFTDRLVTSKVSSDDYWATLAQ